MYGLIAALNVQPYSRADVWRALIHRPFESHDVGSWVRLHSLLARIMIRSVKADMERLGESSAFPASVQHFHVLLAGCDHSGLKYVPFRASEIAAYRSALCGVDPFNPSGKPPTSEWQQRKERAAAMGLDGIVRFLLATVRTIPAQAHAADNGSRSR